VYLIYRGQKPKVLMSRAEVKKNSQDEIDLREMRLSDKIKTSHLKNYLQTEATLFNCGRKNFIRLNERFKHDDVKLGQVVKDWIDYIEILTDVIFESEMLDVSTSEESDEHFDKRDELYVKIQAIEKRFKDLLGDEYVDSVELIKSQEQMFKDLISKEQINPRK